MDTLKCLRDIGNTVIVVEYNEVVLELIGARSKNLKNISAEILLGLSPTRSSTFADDGKGGAGASVHGKLIGQERTRRNPFVLARS